MFTILVVLFLNIQLLHSRLLFWMRSWRFSRLSSILENSSDFESCKNFKSAWTLFCKFFKTVLISFEEPLALFEYWIRSFLFLNRFEDWILISAHFSWKALIFSLTLRYPEHYIHFLQKYIFLVFFPLLWNQRHCNDIIGGLYQIY